MSIGHSFIELESVDSTNNYATAQVHAGMASHGDIFFAHEQWAGKGQRGKTWASLPGENIIMSVVLKPVFLPITQKFLLGVCVALSCHDFYSRYAGAGEIFIKWPNDLYWRDRKAGGILIENSFRGEQWLVAIAGIGININQVQFPESLRNPVSLKQITGRSFDAVKMARELGDCLGFRYEQLQAKGGASQLAEYNACLYKSGQAVKLKKDNTVFETIVQSVTAGGELVTRDTLERQFSFGEVEWMIG